MGNCLQCFTGLMSHNIVASHVCFDSLLSLSDTQIVNIRIDSFLERVKQNCASSLSVALFVALRQGPSAAKRRLSELNLAASRLKLPSLGLGFSGLETRAAPLAFTHWCTLCPAYIKTAFILEAPFSGLSLTVW